MNRGLAAVVALTVLSSFIYSLPITQAYSDLLVTDLLMDTGEDAGDVLVWHDAVNLYVEYIAAESWCLVDTSLHVATDVDGIPQAKNGNPQPGRFAAGADYDPCAPGDTFEFSLVDNGWSVGQGLIIAAQATVRKPEEPQAVSAEGSAVLGPITADPFADGDPFNDWSAVTQTATIKAENWIGINPNPLTDSESCGSFLFNWGNGQSTDVSGAQWISTARDTENWWEDSWRWFPVSITVNDTSAVGSVTVNADNVYWVYVNGVLTGQDHDIFGPLATHTFTPTVGTNNLDFFLRNVAAGSEGVVADQCRNPNGLTFSVSIADFREEAVWANGLEFGGPGSATYVEYNFQGCIPVDGILLGRPGREVESVYDHPLGNPSNSQFGPTYISPLARCSPIELETVEVSSNGLTVLSLITLESGTTYILEASGTYTYWPSQTPDAGIADAKYSLRPNGSFNAQPDPAWVSGDDLPSPWENYLELWVDGSPLNWGDFSPMHIYRIVVIGGGEKISFRILDSNSGDNSGTLQVTIYELP